MDKGITRMRMVASSTRPMDELLVTVLTDFSLKAKNRFYDMAVKVSREQYKVTFLKDITRGVRFRINAEMLCYGSRHSLYEELICFNYGISYISGGIAATSKIKTEMKKQKPYLKKIKFNK
jgi:hypothetical protein